MPPTTEPPCVHRWHIPEAASSRTVTGVCAACGAEREFAVNLRFPGEAENGLTHIRTFSLKAANMRRRFAKK